MDISHALFWASQVALVLKNLPAHARGVRDVFQSLGQEDLLEGGHGKPTSVFLPGASPGQRSLVGNSL